MKTIKLAKDWRHQVNATTVHEYPAGWSGEVSNEAAEHAAAADVLDGSPAETSVTTKRAKVSAPKTGPAKKKAAKPVTPTPEPEPKAVDAPPTEG